MTNFLCHKQNQSGMTLLELLIVVAILSATALTALTTVDKEHEHLNFSSTQLRIESLKKAVVGHAIQTSPGIIAIDGFVADMGRLPVSIEELTTKIMDCDDDDTDEIDADGDGVADDCQWQYDSISQLWHGWQGPYLSTLSDSAQQLSFRDGWRNIGTAPNYGWSVSFNDSNLDTREDEMVLQSLGKDALVNPAAVVNYDALSFYEQDYPPTGSPTVDPTQPPAPIIVSNDHEVNVKGMNIHFHFINPCTLDVDSNCTGPAITPNLTNLRIKLFYREHGQIKDLPTWPATEAARTAEPNISNLIDVNTLSVVDDIEQVVTYQYTATDVFLPWGRQSFILVNEGDGTQYSNPMINQSFPKSMMLLPKSTLPEIHIYWRLE